MADSVDTRAVLAAEGITASIDDQSLVAPTDITVSAGECLALTGPNGSGKTTLLRLLSGRLAPTGGSVLLDDEPVDERSDEVRAALAILIGVPALYPDLTVGDHLQLVHATWGLDGEVDTDLARFGIDGLRDRFVHELSSGQQQLFSLALVFSRPSRVILLDEPEQRCELAHRLLAEAQVVQRGGLVRSCRPAQVVDPPAVQRRHVGDDISDGPVHARYGRRTRALHEDETSNEPREAHQRLVQGLGEVGSSWGIDHLLPPGATTPVTE